MPKNRLNGDSQRFIGFAFAAADLLVETDPAGVIAFATGAFRAVLGTDAEALVGRPVSDLVARSDHALLRSMVMLAAHGRTPPSVVHLADPARTQRVLGGLGLPSPVPRVCLTFSPPPAPLAAGPAVMTAGALSQSILQDAAAGALESLHLVEVNTPRSLSGRVAEILVAALADRFPDMGATQLAPGRFSVAGCLPAGHHTDGSLASHISRSLSEHGVSAPVASQAVDIRDDTLTQAQIAMTLRRALQTFARDGAPGLESIGMTEGLASSLAGAMAQTQSIRTTIRNGQFTMAYQPIVLLNDGSVQHCEALIRPNAASGFRSPQDFICLVETLNMAEVLDLAVARIVCEQAERSPVPLAFNVSAQSLQAGGFGLKLTSLLAGSAAVRGRRVLMEMTETAALDDLDQVRATVQRIRDMAVPFCIDDFGAGTADLKVLHRVGADYVKLDASYIHDIARPGMARTFAQGVTTVARSAAAKVIAEGVEAPEQADVLRGIEIQHAQGYLFARPGPVPLGKLPA